MPILSSFYFYKHNNLKNHKRKSAWRLCLPTVSQNAETNRNRVYSKFWKWRHFRLALCIFYSQSLAVNPQTQICKPEHPLWFCKRIF